MFTIKKLLSSLIAILVLSLLSSCGPTDAANGAKPKLIAEKGDTLVYQGGSRRFIAKFENGAFFIKFNLIRVFYELTYFLF